MSKQPFTLPAINFAAAAQRSDIRYCELLKLVAAHKVQVEHKNGEYLAENQDKYLKILESKIQLLKKYMDNAIDAGDIAYSKRTATAEMEEIKQLLETAEAYAAYQSNDPVIYDVRANLDINIQSFILWATKKRIPIPNEFYEFNQIEPPENLKQNVAETSTNKMLSDFTEMLIEFVINIAQRDKPTNDQFEQIFNELLASVSHHKLIQESNKKIFNIAKEKLGNWIADGRPKTSVRDNMVKAAIHLTRKNIQALSDDSHKLTKKQLDKQLASSGLRLAAFDRDTVVNLFLGYLDGEK